MILQVHTTFDLYFCGLYGYIFLMVGESTVAQENDVGQPAALNIGYGLAWSYYYGYLKLILPGMEERAMKSSYWSKSPSELGMCPHLTILLPKSTFCPPSFSDVDARISPVGKLEPKFASRAGNIARPYQNQVYRLERGAGRQPFFVIAEFATPLLTLYEMKEAGVLTPKQCEAERHQFIQTLEGILAQANRNNNNAFKAFQLLMFDDDETSSSGRQLFDILEAASEDQLEKYKVGYTKRFGEAFPVFRTVESQATAESLWTKVTENQVVFLVLHLVLFLLMVFLMTGYVYSDRMQA